MSKKFFIGLIIFILLSVSVFLFYNLIKKAQDIQLSNLNPQVNASRLSESYEKTRTIYVGSSNPDIVLNYAVHWNATSQTEGIYNQNGQLVTKGLKQYLEEYTLLHPNIAFNIRIILEDDWAQRLKLWFENNYSIDIFQSETNAIADFVKAQMVDLPPDDIVADIKANYVTYQNAFYQDKIWGYPTEINTYQLVYNKKILNEVGIKSPPKTWNDLIDVAIKTTKKDENNRIIRYGFAFDKALNWQVAEPFLAMLFTNNGKFIENNTSYLNQPEAVATLQAQVDLFQKGATNTGISTYNFQNGTVAMILSPPWLETTFKNSFGNQFEQTVGVAPVPYLKNPGTFEYGWYIGVESQSKYKDEAWKFLKWFNSDIQPSTHTTRMGDFLVQNIGVIPSRRLDIENHPDQLGDSFTAPYVESLKIAKSQSYFLHDSEIKNILRENIVLAWNQYKTPEEALNDATVKINGFLKLE